MKCGQGLITGKKDSILPHAGETQIAIQNLLNRGRPIENNFENKNLLFEELLTFPTLSDSSLVLSL